MTSYYSARHVGVQLVHSRRACDGREMQRLYYYTKGLSGEAKKRYQEKISVVNGIDPFRGCFGEPVEEVSPVDVTTWCHIWFCRLILSPQSSLKLTNLLKPTISLCVAG